MTNSLNLNYQFFNHLMQNNKDENIEKHPRIA